MRSASASSKKKPTTQQNNLFEENINFRVGLNFVPALFFIVTPFIGKKYCVIKLVLLRPNCKKVGQNSCNVLGDSKIRVFVICLSLFNY